MNSPLFVIPYLIYHTLKRSNRMLSDKILVTSFWLDPSSVLFGYFVYTEAVSHRKLYTAAVPFWGRYAVTG